MSDHRLQTSPSDLPSGVPATVSVLTAADWVDPAALPSGPGCADCSAVQPSGWWFHLRRCATCGHVGCCDSSPQQHAREHYEQTGHPVIRSYEPGEDWFFDYRTGDYATCPEVCAPLARPEDQPAPGPLGRVPTDWKQQLH